MRFAAAAVHPSYTGTLVLVLLVYSDKNSTAHIMIITHAVGLSVSLLQRMKPYDCGDSLTLQLVPPTGQDFI